MSELKSPPTPNLPEHPVATPREAPVPEVPRFATRRLEPTAPVSDPLAMRVVGRALGLLIVLAAIVLGFYVTRLYYVYPRTDDAYVRANVVGIAAHVSGPIVQMPIVDNQHVKEGGLLFVVDPRPYQSAVDKAEAELALTNLQIKALEDTIR